MRLRSKLGLVFGAGYKNKGGSSEFLKKYEIKNGATSNFSVFYIVLFKFNECIVQAVIVAIIAIIVC